MQEVRVEDYALWVTATKRLFQVRTAGYRAYAVDMRTAVAPSGFTGSVRVFIERGKHPDLNNLPRFNEEEQA